MNKYQRCSCGRIRLGNDCVCEQIHLDFTIFLYQNTKNTEEHVNNEDNVEDNVEDDINDINDINIEEKIRIIIEETGVTRDNAIISLENNKGDVVDTIFNLQH